MLCVAGPESQLFLYVLSAIMNKNVAHLQALSILSLSEVSTHRITEFALLVQDFSSHQM